jgi:hypothetical protein
MPTVTSASEKPARIRRIRLATDSLIFIGVPFRSEAFFSSGIANSLAANNAAERRR